jgi:hypothetical protein
VTLASSRRGAEAVSPKRLEAPSNKPHG